ncbi:hypothetical protein HBI50_219310 [Parastagonospora nodorum]|nr:hypothetical protein HBI50_219310 [Parastagonospora nodorum]
MTLIKNDNDLLGTVNSHIKLRRLRAVMLLCQTTKLPGDSNKNGPPLKRCKTKAADSRHAKPDSLLDSNDYRLDSSSDINSKDNLEDEEATTAKDLAREQKERLKALLNANVSIDDLQNKRTIKLPAYAYILYFKELLSNNSRIFANAIGIGKTRAIVLATEVQNAQAEGDVTEHNAVNDNNKLCPTKGERTFYCACERSPSFNAEPRQAAIIITTLRFCFFSNSPPENIGRPTKEEAIEMRIDTTNAISKALAAANKLVAPQSYTIPEANTPAVHSKATKHCPAPLAAQFVIVCSFRKVDKHVFRAYNTISITAQRTIIRKGSPYVEKRAILLSGHVTALSGTPIEQGLNEILIFMSLALISLQNRKGRDSVTSNRIYKIEDAVYRSIAETLSYRTCQNTALNSLAIAKQWRNIIANVKHDASEHESSHEFMLKRTLKTRNPWGKLISGIKGDFLPYFQSCLCLDFLSTVQNAEQQCRDILEKEGLNKSEASRRVIFNRFEMQAIASYPALATLKAAQFKTYSSCKVKRFTSNSVKDLFTNLSKDYFLVREARAITKSSLNIAAEDAAKAANTLPLPKKVRAKILIESYKPIKFSDESVLVMQRGMTQDPDRPWIIVASMAFAEAITLTEATHVLAEMCVSIIYFNPDSELELKVLGKQDVKTTSRDKL